METAPAYQVRPVIAKTEPVVLSAQQKRVLEQLDLLRNMEKGSKLLLEFDGKALCMCITHKAGRVE